MSPASAKPTRVRTGRSKAAPVAVTHCAVTPGAVTPAPRGGLGEAFIDDLFADWCQHGRAVIEAIRSENPAVYLRVVGSVAPREVVLSGTPFDGLSQEELRHIAGVLEKALADPSDHVTELLTRIQIKPDAKEGS